MAGILSYPIGYRGLTLNNQYDTDGELIGRDNVYVVERFDFSRLELRDPREGLHLHTGGLVGPATKQFRYLSLMGSIRAESQAKLEDMAAALSTAFDIEGAQLDTPTLQGVHPLDFYCPTEVAGYSPLVHELFNARPTAMPRIYERRSTGTTLAFEVELACPDPRRYLYDPEEIEFNATDGWTQTLPNWGSDGPDEVSPPGAMTFAQLLIDMGGAGSSEFTIAPAHTSATFEMDLSGTSGQIVVDMDTMQIYRASDGAYRSSLRTSDVDSWLRILPGGVEWEMINTTGIDSVVATYRQARS
jgi:hypothetical protein